MGEFYDFYKLYKYKCDFSLLVTTDRSPTITNSKWASKQLQRNMNLLVSDTYKINYRDDEVYKRKKYQS